MDTVAIAPKGTRDCYGLRIVAHRAETPSGPRYWFDVQGDLDSCGHRHETRLEAGQCMTAMIRRHLAEGGA